jgi:flagellin
VSMRINTNIEALNAQRNLGVTANSFAASVEKLSSGLRINRAADDAAGLAISQKLSAQVSGLNQAQRNAQDGISMVQTAEGALSEVHSMLQRVRELAVEGANATIGKSDAASIASEITALQAEITRISGATTFNGANLLTGTNLNASQSGGGVMAGTVLVTGTNTSVTAVNVSGAKAGANYTLSTTGSADQLKLADGSGNSQVVTVNAVSAKGSGTISFANLGVSITVSSVGGESGANIATALAGGGAVLPSLGIGGTPGVNLQVGNPIVYTPTSPNPASGVSFNPGLGGISGPFLLGTPSPGTLPGALTLSVDGNTGAITATNGIQSFTGSLAAAVDLAITNVTLVDTHGNSVALNYVQGTGANWLQQAADMNGATFNFPSASGASVTDISANAGAVAGTYTFSSTAPGTITLTGAGGADTVAVGIVVPGSPETLTFANNHISLTITDVGGGTLGTTIVSNLLAPGNNSIVVTSSGGGAGAVTPTITMGAGTQARFQIGANASDTLGVDFADARTSAYSGFDAAIANFVTATTGTWSTTGANAADALITATDTAIDKVSSIRAGFGAVENRLTHTVASVGVASENLNASASRIKDLDVAAEMVNFTKTQILQQAGTAILAQANSAPQGVLALLR